MLDLHPYRQEQSHICIPACIRMVLAYYGKKHSNLPEAPKS